MKNILRDLVTWALFSPIIAVLWLFAYAILGVPPNIPANEAYAVESPCYWQGSVAKCLPSSGIYLDNSKVLRLGTDDDTHYVEQAAPTGMSSNWILTWPPAHGNAGQVLYDQLGDGGLSWRDAGISPSDLTTALERVSSKPSADLVCHSNVTLSSVQTCDGQSTTGAVRVLLMGQTDPTENGLYSNSDVGAWTRYPNMGSLADLPGALVTVTEQGGGTSYQDSLWFGTGDGGSTANFRLVPTTASNTQLTASDAVVTDSNSHLAASSTTATELSYVHNVTSAIQTQLGTKTTNPGTTTGDITYCSNTATPCTSARLGIGSAATVLHGGASAPAYSAVSLTVDVTGTLPIGNGGTGQTTKAPAFDALSPMSNAGDIIYGGTSGTGTRLGIGSATTVLHGGASAPAYSAVSLTADVTGTLAAGNGGTGITSLGTGVATWLGTPSSANLASALTDETGTGAAVFGTSPTIATPSLTGNNGASTVAAGNIGEVLSQMGNSTTCNTSTFVTVASITLTAGTWMISAGAEQSDAGTTAIELQYRYNSTNNTTLGDGYWIWPGDATAGSSGTIPTRFQQVVSGDASKVAAIQLRASVANNKTCVGAITAIRVQ